MIVLWASAFTANAQMYVSGSTANIDTLKVVFHDDKWAIEHEVKQDDNLFKLSKRYHVPPALLTDLNKIDFQTSLQPGSILYIPYGPYNQAKMTAKKRSDVRPLYYIVRKYDNLYRLAHLAGVQQKVMQQWNNMPDNYIEQGKRLFVGWVLYDMSAPVEDRVAKKKEDSSSAEKESPTMEHRVRELRVNENGDTVIVYRKITPFDTLPEIHKAYLLQTDHEQVIMEEKGSAVFFQNKGKLSSSDVFFAFHNTAKPGTIIKVYNPGTDKTVFVKVLGAIPDSKLYHNSIIGIGDGAKAELGVIEDKAWCELTYAPPQ